VPLSSHTPRLGLSRTPKNRFSSTIALSKNHGRARPDDNGVSISTAQLAEVNAWVHGSPHGDGLALPMRVPSGNLSREIWLSGGCRYHGELQRLLLRRPGMRDRSSHFPRARGFHRSGQASTVRRQGVECPHHGRSGECVAQAGLPGFHDAFGSSKHDFERLDCGI
jgi:hypothetical protein